MASARRHAQPHLPSAEFGTMNACSSDYLRRGWLRLRRCQFRLGMGCSHFRCTRLSGASLADMPNMQAWSDDRRQPSPRGARSSIQAACAVPASRFRSLTVGRSPCSGPVVSLRCVLAQCLAALCGWCLRPQSVGWASLPCRPVAADRNCGGAAVLHCIAALQVQPALVDGPAGPLLPPTRQPGAGCGGEEKDDGGKVG